MKPNFALDLTHEGISLLHRGRAEWLLIDAVDLASDDLSRDMGVLRKTAAELEPQGITTKLLIPSSQVLYKTLDAPGDTPEERVAALQAGLEGATPYAVDDLIFDWQAGEGTIVHLAVVARDTLHEAENFAVEYRFNPVSLATMAPDGVGFEGEAHFGETDFAATLLNGEVVEPDGQADAAPEEGMAEEPGAADEAPVQVEETDATTSDTDPKPDAPDEPAPTFASRRETEGDTAPAGVTLSKVSSRLSAVVAPQPDAGPSTEADDTAPDDPAPEAVTETDETPEPAPPPEPRKPLAAARLAASKLVPGAPSTPKLVGDRPAPIAPPSDVLPGRPRMSFDPRGKGRPAKVAPVSAAAPIADAAQDEAAKLTVFGARKAPKPGQSRLGLILTVVLLIFLVAVAVLSTIYLPETVARLFRSDLPEQVETATTPQVPALSDNATDIPNEAELAGEPDLPETDLASATDTGTTIDALIEDALTSTRIDGIEAAAGAADAALLLPMTEAQAQTRYIETGVWQRAPRQARLPQDSDLQGVYLASIDPTVARRDLLLLQGSRALSTDNALPGQVPPPPPGAQFDLDDNNLVRATPEGALTPEGVLVFAGRPDPLPLPRPFVAEAEPAPLANLTDGPRPLPRPASFVALAPLPEVPDLAESIAVLATPDQPRPLPRPVSDDQTALDAAIDAAVADASLGEEAVDISSATEQAVAQSAAPLARPGDMDVMVATARANGASNPVPAASAAAATPAVAPSAAPVLPTRTSVARAATQTNAISLSKVTLIGVYGSTTARRALVRLPSGRFVKVAVGDRVDGGRVAAIGSNSLSYSKGGRNVVLKLPSS